MKTIFDVWGKDMLSMGSSVANMEHFLEKDLDYLQEHGLMNKKGDSGVPELTR